VRGADVMASTWLCGWLRGWLRAGCGGVGNTAQCGSAVAGKGCGEGLGRRGCNGMAERFNRNRATRPPRHWSHNHHTAYKVAATMGPS